jgi:hypothetical protein
LGGVRLDIEKRFGSVAVQRSGEKMENCGRNDQSRSILLSKHKSAYSMKSTSSWNQDGQNLCKGYNLNAGAMSIEPKMGKVLPEVSTLSKKSPFMDDIDITSINVRKFNLDICED